MAPKISPEEAASRRDTILQAARWCFLNFGFSKTSLDDIARRASISRTLLYKTFKDKEHIFAAVFEHWLVVRHPAALEAADSPGSSLERLVAVCRIMALEPWADMFSAPMAKEFYDICDRLEPEVSNVHRMVAIQCFAKVLGDDLVAEVFYLALNGLLTDDPKPDVLSVRVSILAERFTIGL